MVVEENNALKNILKGAVVICEDGDMKDVSFHVRMFANAVTCGKNQ